MSRQYARRLCRLPVFVAASLLLTPVRGEDLGLEIAPCIEPLPEGAVAPLFSGLGDAVYPVTTRGPDAELAQRYFTQGMTLLYAFNHPEAIHSFAQAARYDTEAPMAYWGIAMVAGPDINTNATQGCYDLAMAAIMIAKKIADAQRSDSSVDAISAERELAFANALGERYRRDPNGTVHADAQAYAEAMKAVVQRFPDDLDAATLYSAALMNIAPWKWWQDGKPTADAAAALEMLHWVLALNPDHLGANHYFIHATEESPWPEEALASARRLAALAPSAGHIQHMPSHVYRRIGDHAKATEANYAAVAVDLAYIRQTSATARYPLHYLSHNQHFLTVSLAIEGRESEAIAAARKLFELVKEFAGLPYNQLFNQTIAHVKADYFFAVPIETAVRFRRWDVLAEFTKQEEASDLIARHQLAFTPAIWAYADVLRLLDEENADETAVFDALETFWSAVDEAPPDLAYGNNSAADIFRIANLVLLARLVEATRDKDLPDVLKSAKIRLARSPVLTEAADVLGNATAEAELTISLWRKAVGVQDALSYNEPPDWYFSTRQSLGAALYRQSRFAEAEAAFREDLQRHRGSGRTLYGIIKSLEAQGKPVPAWLEAQFRRAWQNANVPLSLAKM